MKQKTIFFALSLVCVFLFACGIIVNNEKFDSAKWKNGDGRARGKMAYDLQNSKVLIGKTKPEVAEMLYGLERMKYFNEDLTKDAWYFGIDTNTFWDIYFAVHFDEKTQKAVSTDIGD